MSCSKKVYLDIEIDGASIGRIVCDLNWAEAPLASKNFYHLCVGDIKLREHRLSYKGTKFHRVIMNFMVQGGELRVIESPEHGSVALGEGGCSIYAREDELAGDSKCIGNFADENTGEFSEPFTLAMANMGKPATNSSQFFITTTGASHLNGRHSIFGRVIAGKSVVRTIEQCKVDKDGVPECSVVIEDCGEWTPDQPVPLYNASNSRLGGDTYEEFPEDNAGLDGENFESTYEASRIIKESGTLLYKQGSFQDAYFKYKKSLRYVNEFAPDIEIDQKHHALFQDLKVKLYLNLTMVLYKLARYDEAIQFASILIEDRMCTDSDMAKAYFRRGNCYLVKNMLEDALGDFENARVHNPDDSNIELKIESTKLKMEQRLEKTKKNISKFFQ